MGGTSEWHGGYEANLISTIVDANCSADVMTSGYEANLISTIVDSFTTQCGCLARL